MTTAVLTSEALTGDLSANTPGLGGVETAIGVPLVGWAVTAALGEAVLSEWIYDVTRWLNSEQRALVRSRRLDLMSMKQRAQIAVAIQSALDFAVAMHEQRLQKTVGGVPVAPPAIFFPAGVYPAAGLRVDARLRLLGEGPSISEIVFGGFAKSDVTSSTATLGDLSVVMVITGGAAGNPSSMDTACAPGGLEGFGITGVAYLLVGDAVSSPTPQSQLPIATHVVTFAEAPIPGYRLQDLYLLASRKDAVSFTTGMTEVHADRVRIDSAGAYAMRVTGKSGVDARPVSLAWTRFTVDTGRPARPPSLDATGSLAHGDSLALGFLVAGNFPSSPTGSNLPTWYAYGPTRASGPASVGAVDANAAVDPENRRYWVWSQGLLGLESTDGSVFCSVSDGRVEVNSLLVPPAVIADPDPKRSSYAPGALVHVKRTAQLTTVSMNTVRGTFSPPNAAVIVQIESGPTRVMLHDVSLGGTEIEAVHFLPAGGAPAAIADGDVPRRLRRGSTPPMSLSGRGCSSARMACPRLGARPRPRRR